MAMVSTMEPGFGNTFKIASGLESLIIIATISHMIALPEKVYPNGNPTEKDYPNSGSLACYDAFRLVIITSNLHFRGLYGMLQFFLSSIIHLTR